MWVPIKWHERMGTVVGFVGSMILLVMVLGGVLQSFHENPLATFVDLVIVLAVAAALVLVFVKLMF